MIDVVAVPGDGLPPLGLGWIGQRAPVIREPDDGIEHIRAPPASDVALRYAQILRGHDQRERAFGADGEHCVMCFQKRRRPERPTQSSRLPKGRISNHAL